MEISIIQSIFKAFTPLKSIQCTYSWSQYSWIMYQILRPINSPLFRCFERHLLFYAWPWLSKPDQERTLLEMARIHGLLEGKMQLQVNSLTKSMSIMPAEVCLAGDPFWMRYIVCHLIVPFYINAQKSPLLEQHSVCCSLRWKSSNCDCWRLWQE